MGYREIVVFAPLVLLVIFFGFYPAPLLDVTAVSVKKLVSGYETAIKAASNSAPASPPPSWGRDREGGIAEHRPSGLPPPLTPPPPRGRGIRARCGGRRIQSEGGTAMNELVAAYGLIAPGDRAGRAAPWRC